jgi:hypothetical protein
MGETRIADRVDAPSDPGTRLENAGADSTLFEETHRGETGDASADNGAVTAPRKHDQQ